MRHEQTSFLSFTEDEVIEALYLFMKKKRYAFPRWEAQIVDPLEGHTVTLEIEHSPIQWGEEAE